MLGDPARGTIKERRPPLPVAEQEKLIVWRRSSVNTPLSFLAHPEAFDARLFVCLRLPAVSAAVCLSIFLRSSVSLMTRDAHHTTDQPQLYCEADCFQTDLISRYRSM
ncbi:hypothetical protein RRG08_044748 [Elysia crispata]|uniref:Uncharacterized protein n=1 Tax=Elysia crispata TaxID=231223 RepID=A0AAE0ZHI1_9GAST|nr:hypothetical protein RRG08_044748 [Elysia crispata]